MVTNIKLNDGKYIATFEICDNNEDYSICSLGQKLTNDVIQVNKTFIDIDIYKSQMQEQDQRIAELEQDLEFTTKTANELIEIKHKLEQELAELKEKAIVPKFKVGQNIFFIDNECQIAQGVVDVILTGQDVFEKWCKYSIDLGVEYEDDIRFIDKNEEEIFATKEETQDKLKEIQGNE